MNLKELNPKSRFSNRAENYAKYRPDYPKEIIDFLNEVRGFNKKSVVADIGSGTGILTKMFLDNGNSVYAIEPNKEMRQASESQLQSYEKFNSIDGASDNTKLESESIDIITAAQSFHWFDPEPTKKEFLRILKENGAVVLMWNIRKRVPDEFMNEYMELVYKYSENLNFKSDSDKETIPNFCEPKTVHKKVFNNPQVFDYERLKGELLSYSYMPTEIHEKFSSMIKELKKLFGKYNNNGEVIIQYETILYYCVMK